MSSFAVFSRILSTRTFPHALVVRHMRNRIPQPPKHPVLVQTHWFSRPMKLFFGGSLHDVLILWISPFAFFAVFVAFNEALRRIFHLSPLIGIQNASHEHEESAKKTEKHETKSKSPENGSLEQILLSHEISDIEVSVDGESFPLHRSVLTAQSKFFKEKLADPNVKKITVNDVSNELMRKLVFYMYTSNLPEIDEQTAGLIRSADKLGVDLKDRLFTSFLVSINPVNFCQRIDLLSQFPVDGKRFMRKMVVFFALNKEKVLASEEWQQLKESNPTAVSEVCGLAWKLAHLSQEKSLQNPGFDAERRATKRFFWLKDSIKQNDDDEFKKEISRFAEDWGAIIASRTWGDAVYFHPFFADRIQKEALEEIDRILEEDKL